MDHTSDQQQREGLAAMKNRYFVLFLSLLAGTSTVLTTDAGLTTTNYPWWGISFSYRSIMSPSDVNGFGPPYEEWSGLAEWITEREINYREVDIGASPLADFCLSRGEPGTTSEKPSLLDSSSNWTVRCANYIRRVSDILIDLRWASNDVGNACAWLQWDVITTEASHPAVQTTEKVALPLGGITDVRIAVWPGWPTPINGYRGNDIAIPEPPKLYYVSKTTAEVQPQKCNTPDTKAVFGDPINALNGNVSISEPDIVIPATGLPLEFHRHYDTMLETDGTLGPRWSHSYQWRIWETNTVFKGATNLWLTLQAGADRHWKPLNVVSGGHEIVDADWLWTAEKTNGVFTVRRPGGYVYRFDTNGYLQGMADAFSNGVALVYTNLAGAQRLARVEHSDGRALSFAYSASNRLDRIETFPTNLTVTYDYADDGTLTNAGRAVGGAVETTRYDWNSTGQTITQRVDNSREITVWEYDGEEGVRSYVGTSRWNEVSLDYGSRSMNQSLIKRYRGDTNVAVCQEYDAVRGRVLATSAAMPPEWLLWARPSTQVVTQVVVHTTSSCIPLEMNGYYRSLMAGPAVSAMSSRQTWSGVRYTLDDYGKTVAIEARDSRVTPQEWSRETLSYDAAHRLISSAFGYQSSPTNAWSFGWNTNWDTLASVTDPEGNRVEWDYTNGAISVERSYPVTNQPVEIRYSYTSNGLPASLTNANGHWTASLYNGYGYPTQTLTQAGFTTWMTWNDLGHLTELRLPGNTCTTNEPPVMMPRTITFDPDELGRVRSITYPDNSLETFTFDGIGNVTNHVDAAGRTNRYTWLPTRKLSSTSRTLVGTSNVEAKIEFAYDQQFNALNITDELGRPVESYQLDLDDRPIKVTNVESQQMTVAWGLGSMVKSVARFDGTTNGLSYDEGGRVQQMTYPDATLAFCYLRNGLLMTASNGAGVVSNAYDGANRLIQTQVSGLIPQPSSIAYQLDAVGNPTNTQAASLGYSVSRSFDVAERLSSLTASPLPLPSFQFAYDVFDGLPSTSSVPNGVWVQYERDIMGRTTKMVWRNATNQVLRSRAYGYSLAGMITNAVDESGERVDYSYDSLDRLTGEKYTDVHGEVISEDRYEYDLAGNRTKKAVLDGATNTLTMVNYALSTGNRLGSWSVAEAAVVGRVTLEGHASEPVGTNDLFGYLWVSNLTAGVVKPQVYGTSFRAYSLPVGLGTQTLVAAIRDMAGNMGYATNTILLTVVTNGTYQHNAAGCVTNIAYRGKDYSQTLGLTWDGQYQLTAAATNGVAVERYGHDAFGRRVWTWDAANGTNWHVYDGPHVIADLNATGGVVRTYVWGPGIDNLLAMTTYGGLTNTYYPLKGHLGSVLALTDDAGNIVESYRYDAWGRTTVYDASGNPLSASAVGNRYCWQGREYSWNTGLYHFRARWYDPVTGRWLSNDPIGISGGLNQYVFCANNPVNFRDPSGLCPENSNYPSYWDRYFQHVNAYVVNPGPAAWAVVGGVWPKSWSIATGGRPPLLGSNNPLTSVPRSLGMPGAGSTVMRVGAEAIGIATVGVGTYNVGVFITGLGFAAFPGSNGLSPTGSGGLFGPWGVWPNGVFNSNPYSK
jgi:RHS repeat-associated protein